MGNNETQIYCPNTTGNSKKMSSVKLVKTQPARLHYDYFDFWALFFNLAIGRVNSNITPIMWSVSIHEYFTLASFVKINIDVKVRGP